MVKKMENSLAEITDIPIKLQHLRRAIRLRSPLLIRVRFEPLKLCCLLSHSFTATSLYWICSKRSAHISLPYIKALPNPFWNPLHPRFARHRFASLDGSIFQIYYTTCDDDDDDALTGATFLTRKRRKRLPFPSLSFFAERTLSSCSQRKFMAQCTTFALQKYILRYLFTLSLHSLCQNLRGLHLRCWDISFLRSFLAISSSLVDYDLETGEHVRFFLSPSSAERSTRFFPPSLSLCLSLSRFFSPSLTNLAQWKFDSLFFNAAFLIFSLRAFLFLSLFLLALILFYINIVYTGTVTRTSCSNVKEQHSNFKRNIFSPFCARSWKVCLRTYFHSVGRYIDRYIFVWCYSTTLMFIWRYCVPLILKVYNNFSIKLMQWRVVFICIPRSSISSLRRIFNFIHLKVMKVVSPKKSRAISRLGLALRR